MPHPTKRIPSRFNRKVSPFTRSVVKKRHQKKRAYIRQRWMRLFSRIKGKAKVICQYGVRWSFIAVCILVIGCVGFVLFSPVLQVREIKIVRDDLRIDIEDVKRTLAPLFGKRLLFLAPIDVILLLEDSIVDMKNVTVHKKYPSTIMVHMTLDPVVAHLIFTKENADALPTATGSTVLQDYLTSEGMFVRYTSSQVQEKDTLEEIYMVDWGVRPTVGTFLLSPDVLTQMREAERRLEDQFGYEITERTVFLRAREFHLQTSLHTLWFDLKSNLNEQFHRYRVFLEHVGTQGVDQYVDLRVRDRVVYR
jgi:hypothetical protein